MPTVPTEFGRQDQIMTVLSRWAATYINAFQYTDIRLGRSIYSFVSAMEIGQAPTSNQLNRPQANGLVAEVIDSNKTLLKHF